MSECPFHGLLNPETYVHGMPFDELTRLRKEDPLAKCEDPITGVPFWAVTKREDIDFISKNPQLFSAAERTVLPMEYPGREWIVTDILRKQMINMDPPEHL